RAFGAKFASIQRNYRVLFGSDPLAGLPPDTTLERFLCEQALRNLRLRMVFAFVTRRRNGAYGRFLLRSVTPLFVQASEALRLNGATIPKDFDARIPLMEKEFQVPGAVLRDLLAFKRQNAKVSDADVLAWHARLF